MAEKVEYSGEAQGSAPQYEAPKHLGRLSLVSEAYSMSVGSAYEAPDSALPRVPAKLAAGSSSNGKADANSQYYW
jgi:hypothetical protein